MALFRHIVQGTFPGEIWSFGLHTSGAGTLNSAQAAWIAGLADFFSVGVLGLLCTDVATIEASTAELDQATGKQSSKVSDPVSHVGTNVTECMPFQCAPVVSLRTQLATRAGRGRFYVPSLAVDQIAGGRMVAGAQTALADGAAAMLTSLDAAAFTPVLYSRTTTATQTITSLDVGDVIDTQRRRRNKLVEARTTRLL